MEPTAFEYLVWPQDPRLGGAVRGESRSWPDGNFKYGEALLRAQAGPPINDERQQRVRQKCAVFCAAYVLDRRFTRGIL
jgi:hypothetical protein